MFAKNILRPPTVFYLAGGAAGAGSPPQLGNAAAKISVGISAEILPKLENGVDMISVAQLDSGNQNLRNFVKNRQSKFSKTTFSATMAKKAIRQRVRDANPNQMTQKLLESGI